MNLALCSAILLLAAIAQAQPIQRSRSEVQSFRSQEPCPATGRTSGACPGWAVDHVIPLCAGGLDRRENMQWISDEDHAFKTRIDVRECRKLARSANTPAK